MHSPDINELEYALRNFHRLSGPKPRRPSEKQLIEQFKNRHQGQTPMQAYCREHAEAIDHMKRVIHDHAPKIR